MAARLRITAVRRLALGLLGTARCAGAPFPKDLPVRCCTESRRIPAFSLMHSACEVYSKCGEHLYVGERAGFPNRKV